MWVPPKDTGDNLLFVGHQYGCPPKTHRPPGDFKFPDTAAFQLKSAGIDVSGWCTPPSGVVFEEMTLRNQCARLKPEIKEVDMAQIVKEVTEEYPMTANSFDRMFTKAYLEAIVQSLKPEATPGAPMDKFFKTNKELMENVIAFSHVVRTAVWRARVLSRIDPLWLEEKLREDPAWAVRLGLSDKSDRSQVVL